MAAPQATAASSRPHEAGRAPAPVRRLDQRERQQADRGGQQPGAGQVRPAADVLVLALRDHPGGQQRSRPGPTGRLIQNTQRQLSWTRLPPITGPSAAPSAPSADQVPMARARAGPGTEASSSDSEAGTIRPAPAAWMTRAAISAATPGARPHSSDPTLNAIRPATNSRRRPTRSAHRPAGTRTAANTIVYPLSTQDSELRLVPPNSRPM